MNSSDPRFLIDADLVAGRKMAAADLGLVILSLLAAAPRHGYEIIAAVQARTLGFYRPSPGAMYPALRHIKESGLATVENLASRKRYRITPAGHAVLAERRERLASVWDRLERNGRKLSRLTMQPATSESVLRARAALDRALRQRARVHPDGELRIAQILNRAAADVAAIEPGAPG